VPDRGIDRMRKTKNVMLACVNYDLLGTLCLEEEVFLLLYMEGSFVLLPADDIWQWLLTFTVT